jgi:hypothetical protein
MPSKVKWLLDLTGTGQSYLKVSANEGQPKVVEGIAHIRVCGGCALEAYRVACIAALV